MIFVPSFYHLLCSWASLVQKQRGHVMRLAFVDDATENFAIEDLEGYISR